MSAPSEMPAFLRKTNLGPYLKATHSHLGVNELVTLNTVLGAEFNTKNRYMGNVSHVSFINTTITCLTAAGAVLDLDPTQKIITFTQQGINWTTTALEYRWPNHEGMREICQQVRSVSSYGAMAAGAYINPVGAALKGVVNWGVGELTNQSLDALAVTNPEIRDLTHIVTGRAGSYGLDYCGATQLTAKANEKLTNYCASTKGGQALALTDNKVIAFLRVQRNDAMRREATFTQPQFFSGKFLASYGAGFTATATVAGVAGFVDEAYKHAESQKEKKKDSGDQKKSLELDPESKRLVAVVVQYLNYQTGGMFEPRRGMDLALVDADIADACVAENQLVKR